MLFSLLRIVSCGMADAVLTVAKGKLMADKLLASGGMTRDKSVRLRASSVRLAACSFFLSLLLLCFFGV